MAGYDEDFCFGPTWVFFDKVKFECYAKHCILLSDIEGLERNGLLLEAHNGLETLETPSSQKISLF
jgi:hypothetical protein